MNRERIESKDNQRLKLVRKLRLKKNRYKEAKFVIESRKLVEEAIKSGLQIDFIILKDSLDNEFANFDLAYVSDQLFSTITEMTNPDGYLAVVKMPSMNNAPASRILLLDGLQDPGNLGTIIRSAEAFGFNSIVLVNSVDPYNEKTLRAAMGSLFRLDIRMVERVDLPAFLKPYTVYVADMDGEDYRKLSYDSKVCLVIGNEANGVSRELFERADKRISIPMKGELESLNAAISASLIMSAIDSSL